MFGRGPGARSVRSRESPQEKSLAQGPRRAPYCLAAAEKKRITARDSGQTVAQTPRATHAGIRAAGNQDRRLGQPGWLVHGVGHDEITIPQCLFTILFERPEALRYPLYFSGRQTACAIFHAVEPGN
jgi:hypothetical protein